MNFSYAEIRASKISICLVTNGTFLENELMEELKNAKEELKNAKEIRFSLDAVEADTYSKIHGVPRDLFCKVLDNIQRVIERETYRNANLLLNSMLKIDEPYSQPQESFLRSLLEKKIVNLDQLRCLLGDKNYAQQKE